LVSVTLAVLRSGLRSLGETSSDVSDIDIDVILATDVCRLPTILDQLLIFLKAFFDIESHGHALTPTKHRRKLPILLFNQTSSISARLG